MSWNYVQAPESASILNVRDKYDLFINNQWVAPKSGKYFKSVNPANGELIAQFAQAEKEDVHTAVQAARQAFDSGWGKLPPQDRAKYLFRIARIIQERSRELAVAETIDGGKPIRESRDIDIPLAANHFFYYAGWADKLHYLPHQSKPESLGVVAQIIPWNFPLLMAAWKIAPALAAGNTVVLKSAESTPLTACLLAEIIEEAQLPEGTVNIVSGDGTTGVALVQHKDINKVAFTGSTAVGKWIQRNLADRNVELTLELGGKSAHIVLDDAAIDEAVEGVINGIFFNQGHVCCAGSRLYLQENIYDLFLKKLKKRMTKLRLGDPLDKNTDIGAINSAQQFKTIQDFLQKGQEEGNSIYQSDCEIPEKGWYIPPTLVMDTSQSSALIREEIFGPVLVIQSFRTIDEVAEKANNTPYGLAAGVWSTNGARIFALTQQIKAGVVWANTYNKFDPSSPFGGFKESGFGREGGLHGLLPYLKSRK